VLSILEVSWTHCDFTSRKCQSLLNLVLLILGAKVGFLRTLFGWMLSARSRYPLVMPVSQAWSGLGARLFAHLGQVIGNGSQSYPTFHVFIGLLAVIPFCVLGLRRLLRVV
jgi:hypothetical protein